MVKQVFQPQSERMCLFCAWLIGQGIVIWVPLFFCAGLPKGKCTFRPQTYPECFFCAWLPRVNSLFPPQTHPLGLFCTWIRIEKSGFQPQSKAVWFFQSIIAQGNVSFSNSVYASVIFLHTTDDRNLNFWTSNWTCHLSFAIQNEGCDVLMREWKGKQNFQGST